MINTKTMGCNKKEMFDLDPPSKKIKNLVALDCSSR